MKKGCPSKVKENSRSRSNKEQRHRSKSEREKRDGKKEEKSCTREGRMECRGKKDVRSEVPVSCLLQDSQRHEAKGTPLAKERATEVGLGSFHTKARIYDKGGPLTPWHLASKLTLLPT